jgi:hypothetical protein
MRESSPSSCCLRALGKRRPNEAGRAVHRPRGGRGPTTARVADNVTIGLDLADGEQVRVHVETEFGEISARASGIVSLDGKTIFDRKWVFPGSE